MAGRGLRERKRRRTEAAIIEAAFGLFNERGFRTSTMEEVAERAEAAVGTLYNYFDSKSHIVVAVLLNETEKYAQQAAIKAKKCSAEPVKRLHTYSDVYLGNYTSYDKDLWSEMFSGLFKDNTRASEFFGADSSILAHISRLMAQKKENGTNSRASAYSNTVFTLHSNLISSVLTYITDKRADIDEVRKSARERTSTIIKEQSG